MCASIGMGNISHHSMLQMLKTINRHIRIIPPAAGMQNYGRALSRLSSPIPRSLHSNVFNETNFSCMYIFFLVFLNVNLLFGQRVAVAFRAVWALENKTRQPEELRGVSCPLPQPQPQPPSIHPSIRPIWQESSCLCADFPRGVWS